ncbi:aminoglycoside phosphotransferase family protein [Salinispora oceanensis]|uniref:phosphotransferase n=1 Tax=Salinispora oceanensis TaxID=1050199 RepID=UPI001CC6D870|nr:phosphotransferase [Salinispora oceanensis]
MGYTVHSGRRLNIDAGDSLAVQHVPGRVGLPVLEVEELRHNRGNAATYGIWRVRGAAGQAVLKIYRPGAPGYTGFWPTSTEPTHWNYWRRESLAYAEGLTSTAYAEAGVSGPEMLETNVRADGLVELWLDYVPGSGGFEWSPSRIARFAYELGAGQARWTGRVPDLPWLSRGWLRQYLADGPPLSVNIEDSDWGHPDVAFWPDPVRQRLRRLWAERNQTLAVAQGVERTLCHLDVWPANLIDVGGRSVLLDWAFAGEGAVGEDISNLILDSFTDGLMDPDLLPEIAEGCVDGYLKGLRDGGWSGSEDAVRVAVGACGAAKFSWFGPAVLGRAVSNDVGSSNYSQDESAELVVKRVAGLVTLIADWARVAGSR